MTIRDEIVLNDRDDATRFMQFLRSKNISTGIRTKTGLTDHISVSGTIKHFTAYFQGKIDEISSYLEEEDECDEKLTDEKLQDEKLPDEELLDEDEYLDDEYDEDEYDEELDFACQSYIGLISFIKIQRSFLEDIFSHYTIGEKIQVSDIEKRIFPDSEEYITDTEEKAVSDDMALDVLQEDADEENDEDFDEDFDEDDLEGLEERKDHLFHLFLLMANLVENQIITPSEEGFIFQKEMDPDDVHMTFPARVFQEEDLETLSEEDFEITNTISDDISYAVTIGPEFFMLDEVSDITDFIFDEELDCEEDDVDSLTYRLYNRQMIVTKIIDIIKENGKMSRDEIITAISDASLSSEEDKCALRFNLSEAFSGAVIDDLKKMGILKGKDLKLKLQI